MEKALVAQSNLLASSSRDFFFTKWLRFYKSETFNKVSHQEHSQKLLRKRQKNKEKTNRLLLRHYACKTDLFVETTGL